MEYKDKKYILKKLMQDALTEEERIALQSSRRVTKEMERQWNNAPDAVESDRPDEPSIWRNICKEVFIKIWETREFLCEDDHFKGLLFIITRNLIFNRHRKNVNEDFYKVTVLAALEEPYDVEEEIDAHNLQEYIDRLIDELPPRRREIFNLSRKEQKSYKEIAILLNISEKTVENQISEALKYLKKNITLLLLFI